jgi:hypothetical protein
MNTAQVGFAEEEVDGSLAILLEIVCLVHTCCLEWSENDILPVLYLHAPHDRTPRSTSLALMKLRALLPSYSL